MDGEMERKGRGKLGKRERCRKKEKEDAYLHGLRNGDMEKEDRGKSAMIERFRKKSKEGGGVKEKPRRKGRLYGEEEYGEK